MQFLYAQKKVFVMMGLKWLAGRLRPAAGGARAGRGPGRLSRQAILERDDPPPPMVCALIDQSALMREIGGPAVMRDQLAHLAAVSRRPNITVQIIPDTGAHPGLLGAFTVADLGGSAGIVNLEDIADGQVTEDAATVSMVALRFHSLRGDALSKGASRDLIEGVIRERWKDLTP